jgi:hypothetical protein
LKIFWSWQSDTPQATGRHFVRAALDAAATRLAECPGLEDAERPEVDSDTSNVPGSPPIAETILRKIRDCAVFVADVTPVGQTPGGKKLVNPNVMIELGYALGTIGHERIILVMNQGEGAGLKSLPFDLRHWRGPIGYSLRKLASAEHHAETLAVLTDDLIARLGPSLAQVASSRPSPLVAEGVAAAVDDWTIWDGARPSQKVRVSPLGEPAELPIADGPNLFARIIPQQAFDASRADMAAHQGDGYPLHLLGDYGNLWNGTSARGAVAWDWIPESKKVNALTQWFQSTGEIWGIWPQVVIPWEGNLVFVRAYAARGLEHFLSHHFKTLARFSAQLPWRVVVGVRGLEGTLMLGGPYRQGGFPAQADEERYEAVVTDLGTGAARAITFAFMRKLFDIYGAPRLTEAEYDSILNEG